ncbi:hypothetical protein AAIH70_29925 [Neorhizobium sp. BT27B]|uniref:hypothetical protein n=1 Tax=Neorhizobium sp. BT27B TaxID=3142625 RepID=UPI003D2654EC
MPDPKTLLMQALSSPSELTADELEPLIRGVLDRIAELQERLGHIDIEALVLDIEARRVRARDMSRQPHPARTVAIQTLIETLEALEQEVTAAVERILRSGK